MLNIVIPMAGQGSRFSKAGFTVPKPLIPIHGSPMIQLVIANLRPACEHRFIFIAQKEHCLRYGLSKYLRQWVADPEIVLLEEITQGAACTVLAAQQWINNDYPLMIANSDQYVDISIDQYLAEMAEKPWDGLIMTMKATDPKWSFAAIDSRGLVTQVAEKEAISTHATVGIYNFAQGKDFVAAANAMIKANHRVKGEFYVAPVYNWMIKEGKKIGIYEIGSEGQGMYGLGVPGDLENFLSTPLSRTVVGLIK